MGERLHYAQKGYHHRKGGYTMSRGSLSPKGSPSSLCAEAPSLLRGTSLYAQRLPLS